MKTVSIDELNIALSEYVKTSQDELILITKNGLPVAALSLVVDPEELERLMLANSSKFNDLLDNSRRSIQETGGMEDEDFWQLVDELSHPSEG
ncbi:MAG: type II toxin-antitoxin system Phd/YefM family antitoxin [Microcoleus sp. SU_5_6]|nr:type II toxin-antitoxin system Phd/YefM family antitoxin [Microcoleus sp. SU_5_6]